LGYVNVTLGYIMASSLINGVISLYHSSTSLNIF